MVVESIIIFLMLKVGITGSSGFIGQYLSAFLKHRGYQVLPISRNFLYSPDLLEDYLKTEQPHYIVHAAAYGNMSIHNDYPQTFQANIQALYNLLIASRDLPYRKLINISSSSVYGITRSVMSESDKINPQTPYATTKAAGELIVRGFKNYFGKNIVTVRPFSVYGPGEADFRFIPTVIRAIKEDKPIILYHGYHDWIYIDDFVRALTIVMEMETEEEIYNIGTGLQTSNRIIVQLLSNIMAKHVKIEQELNEKEQDSHTWVANINSLILLGFVPNFTLQSGLIKTVERYG